MLKIEVSSDTRQQAYTQNVVLREAAINHMY